MERSVIAPDGDAERERTTVHGREEHPVKQGRRHTHAAQAEADAPDESTEPTAEALALLGYLLDHHRHHVAEMKEAGESLDSEARALVAEAALLYERGNEKLAQALEAARKDS